MNRINRSSKLPLYHQLYEILRGNILDGTWKPGDMLPPESELIEQYEISRTTVRQVFDLLVNDGLVYRQRGRGTFVSHPTVEQSLLRIVSFTDDMRQRGFEPGTEVLTSDLIPAPTDIAKKLQIDPDNELAHIKRLRTADGEPMSIEASYLVHEYCPGILKYDYATHPLREVLDHEYGIRWLRASQVICARQADKDLAQRLSIPPKAALLCIERISFSEQEIPVEYLRIYYRGDRYSLYTELQG